jgi:hypothetical protein
MVKEMIAARWRPNSILLMVLAELRCILRQRAGAMPEEGTRPRCREDMFDALESSMPRMQKKSRMK